MEGAARQAALHFGARARDRQAEGTGAKESALRLQARRQHCSDPRKQPPEDIAVLTHGWLQKAADLQMRLETFLHSRLTDGEHTFAPWVATAPVIFIGCRQSVPNPVGSVSKPRAESP